MTTILVILAFCSGLFYGMPIEESKKKAVGKTLPKRRYTGGRLIIREIGRSQCGGANTGYHGGSPHER